MKSQLTTAKDELRVLEVQCQQHEKMQAVASNVADLETAKARAAADEDFLHALRAISFSCQNSTTCIGGAPKAASPNENGGEVAPASAITCCCSPTTPTHEGRDQLHTSSTRASTENDVRPFAALTNNEKQDQHDYMHYAAAAGEDSMPLLASSWLPVLHATLCWVAPTEEVWKGRIQQKANVPPLRRTVKKVTTD